MGRADRMDGAEHGCDIDHPTPRRVEHFAAAVVGRRPFAGRPDPAILRGGGVFAMFAVFAVIGDLTCVVFSPETAGKTLEQLSPVDTAGMV